jgi:hypothetical protein
MLRFLEWFMPDWAVKTCPDPNHSHGRRLTETYKKKQGIVRNLWIGSGFIMLLIPVLPYLVAAALLTTFLSFVILDETE